MSPLFRCLTTSLLAVAPAFNLHASPPRRSSSLRLSAGDDLPFSYEDGRESSRVLLPIGEEVGAKQIVFSLASNRLTLGVSDAPLAIDDEQLWGRVVANDCYWEIDEIEGRRCVLLELQKRDPGSWEYLLQSQYSPPDETISERCFLEIEIDGEPAGRIVIGLFGKQVRAEIDALVGVTTHSSVM
ncbi:MAG: hypothetical protein SGPRY_009098 [Prymnesium sp.]